MAVRVLPECILVCNQIWISAANLVFIDRESILDTEAGKARFDEYSKTLTVRVLCKRRFAVVVRHWDHYVDRYFVDAYLRMIKSLPNGELFVHFVMSDECWHSSHFYCLLVATCIRLVLEAVGAPSHIWVTDSVRNVGHRLKVNYVGDGAGIDRDFEVLLHEIKCFSRRLVIALIIVRDILPKLHSDRMLADVLNPSSRQNSFIIITPSLRVI